MINLEDELAEEYLAECRKHLATIETNLIGIQTGEAEVEGSVNNLFRAVRSIHRGAGSFDLIKIRELANQTEDVLTLIRSGEMAVTPDRVRVLLLATDRLQDLVDNPGASNKADITGMMAALARLDAENQIPERLRVLLVEDDFASRLLLQTFLSRYGECHVAVNGREAVEAFQLALNRGQNYDLVCMDIMMPEMDGQEAVGRMRTLEEANGIFSTQGAKIIMTTAVTDIKEVGRCFRSLCDSYLTKPIDLGKLLNEMKACHLVPC